MLTNVFGIGANIVTSEIDFTPIFKQPIPSDNRLYNFDGRLFFDGKELAEGGDLSWARNENVIFPTDAPDGNQFRVAINRETVADGLVLDIFGNARVDGNLQVTGELVSVDQLNVENNLIGMAENNDGDSLDLGFVGRYTDLDETVRFAGLYRDHTDKTFKLFRDTEQPNLPNVQTIDSNAGGYALADLNLAELGTIGIRLADNEDPVPTTNLLYRTGDTLFFAGEEILVGTGIKSKWIVSPGGETIHPDEVPGEGKQYAVAIGKEEATGGNVLDVQGNTRIDGDLKITGDLVEVNQLIVDTSIIGLANGNPGDAIDIGIVGKYVEDDTNKFAGLYRDHTNSKFTLFKGSEQETLPGVQVIDKNAEGYELAELIAGEVETSAVKLEDGEPAETDAKLYNIGGELFWNGEEVSTADLTWVINEDIIHPATFTEEQEQFKVAIGKEEVTEGFQLDVEGDTRIEGNIETTGETKTAAIELEDGEPAETDAKLYNVGGELFWNGEEIGVNASGWTIDNDIIHPAVFEVEPGVFEQRKVAIGKEEVAEGFQLDIDGNTQITGNLETSGEIKSTAIELEDGEPAETAAKLYRVGNDLEWSGEKVIVGEENASKWTVPEGDDSTIHPAEFEVEPGVFEQRKVAIGTDEVTEGFQLEVEGDSQFAGKVKTTAVELEDGEPAETAAKLYRVGDDLEWSGEKVIVGEESASKWTIEGESIHPATFTNEQQEQEQRKVAIGKEEVAEGFQLDVLGDVQITGNARIEGNIETTEEVKTAAVELEDGEPAETTAKLYRVENDLFWAGEEVATGQASVSKWTIPEGDDSIIHPATFTNEQQEQEQRKVAIGTNEVGEGLRLDVLGDVQITGDSRFVGNVETTGEVKSAALELEDDEPAETAAKLYRVGDDLEWSGEKVIVGEENESKWTIEGESIHPATFTNEQQEQEQRKVAIGKEEVAEGFQLDVEGDTQITGNARIEGNLEATGETKTAAIELEDGEPAETAAKLYRTGDDLEWSGEKVIVGEENESKWTIEGEIIHPEVFEVEPGVFEQRKVAIGTNEVTENFQLDVLGDVQITGNTRIEGNIETTGETKTAAVELEDGEPAETAAKLYNDEGNLFWAGSPVVVGEESISKWTIEDESIHPATFTNEQQEQEQRKVAIGKEEVAEGFQLDVLGDVQITGDTQFVGDVETTGEVKTAAIELEDGEPAETTAKLYRVGDDLEWSGEKVIVGEENASKWTIEGEIIHPEVFEVEPEVFEQRKVAIGTNEVAEGFQLDVLGNAQITGNVRIEGNIETTGEVKSAALELEDGEPAETTSKLYRAGDDLEWSGEKVIVGEENASKWTVPEGDNSVIHPTMFINEQEQEDQRKVAIGRTTVTENFQLDISGNTQIDGDTEITGEVKSAALELRDGEPAETDAKLYRTGEDLFWAGEEVIVGEENASKWTIEGEIIHPEVFEVEPEVFEQRKVAIGTNEVTEGFQLDVLGDARIEGNIETTGETKTAAVELEDGEPAETAAKLYRTGDDLEWSGEKVVVGEENASKWRIENESIHTITFENEEEQQEHFAVAIGKDEAAEGFKLDVLGDAQFTGNISVAEKADITGEVETAALELRDGEPAETTAKLYRVGDDLEWSGEKVIVGEENASKWTIEGEIIHPTEFEVEPEVFEQRKVAIGTNEVTEGFQLDVLGNAQITGNTRIEGNVETTGETKTTAVELEDGEPAETTAKLYRVGDDLKWAGEEVIVGEENASKWRIENESIHTITFENEEEQQEHFAVAIGKDEVAEGFKLDVLGDAQFTGNISVTEKADITGEVETAALELRDGEPAETTAKLYRVGNDLKWAGEEVIVGEENASKWRIENESIHTITFENEEEQQEHFAVAIGKDEAAEGFKLDVLGDAQFTGDSQFTGKIEQTGDMEIAGNILVSGETKTAAVELEDGEPAETTAKLYRVGDDLKWAGEEVIVGEENASKWRIENESIHTITFENEQEEQEHFAVAIGKDEAAEGFKLDVLGDSQFAGDVDIVGDSQFTGNITVTEKADITGEVETAALELKDGEPAETTAKLYRVGGDLKWAGEDVIVGEEKASKWRIENESIHTITFENEQEEQEHFAVAIGKDEVAEGFKLDVSGNTQVVGNSRFAGRVAIGQETIGEIFQLDVDGDSRFDNGTVFMTEADVATRTFTNILEFHAGLVPMEKDKSIYVANDGEGNLVPFYEDVRIVIGEENASKWRIGDGDDFIHTTTFENEQEEQEHFAVVVGKNTLTEGYKLDVSGNAQIVGDSQFTGKVDQTGDMEITGNITVTENADITGETKTAALELEDGEPAETTAKLYRVSGDLKWAGEEVIVGEENASKWRIENESIHTITFENEQEEQEHFAVAIGKDEAAEGFKLDVLGDSQFVGDSQFTGKIEQTGNIETTGEIKTAALELEDGEPAETTAKLYRVGGDLKWAGEEVIVGEENASKWRIENESIHTITFENEQEEQEHFAVAIGKDEAAEGFKLDVLGDSQFTGDIKQTGNAEISGNLTGIEQLEVEDNLIGLASGNSADEKDIGFVGEYTEDATTKYAGLYRDHTDGRFKIFTESEQENLPDAETINSGADGYRHADLDVRRLRLEENNGIGIRILTEPGQKVWMGRSASDTENALVFDGSNGQLLRSTANLFFDIATGDSSGRFMSIREGSGENELFRLLQNGRLGIGESNPAAKLTVRFTSQFTTDNAPNGRGIMSMGVGSEDIGDYGGILYLSQSRVPERAGVALTCRHDPESGTLIDHYNLEIYTKPTPTVADPLERVATFTYNGKLCIGDFVVSDAAKLNVRDDTQFNTNNLPNGRGIMASCEGSSAGDYGGVLYLSQARSRQRAGCAIVSRHNPSSNFDSDRYGMEFYVKEGNLTASPLNLAMTLTHTQKLCVGEFNEPDAAKLNVREDSQFTTGNLPNGRGIMSACKGTNAGDYGGVLYLSQAFAERRAGGAIVCRHRPDVPTAIDEYQIEIFTKPTGDIAGDLARAATFTRDGKLCVGDFTQGLAGKLNVQFDGNFTTSNNPNGRGVFIGRAGDGAGETGGILYLSQAREADGSRKAGIALVSRHTGGTFGLDRYALEIYTKPSNGVQDNLQLNARFGDIDGNNGTNLRVFGDIVGNSYSDSSDERIKEDIVISDQDTNLDIVKQINVYNYSYIDKEKRGENTVAGFIAQEVKEIYPQAVKTITDAIPNILSTGNIEDKVLIFDQKEAEIEVGDYLQINSTKIEVTEINGPGNVTLDTELSGEVFVYGVYVNNFLLLKKDKLYSILFSAVKKLINENEEKEAQIIELQEKYESLEQRISNLEK